MAQLITLPYIWGRSTCYADRLDHFSGTVHQFYNDVYINSFILFCAYPDSGIFCLKNDFLWPMISMTVSLELTDTFHLYVLSKQIPCMLRFFLYFFLVISCLVVAVQSCMEWILIFLKEKRKKVSKFNCTANFLNMFFKEC